MPRECRRERRTNIEMKMKHRFLNIEENFPAITRKNIIISIVAGLFFSFVFYSFLYLSREIFRLFSISDKFSFMVLSDKEVSFYNLFFAFLSLIFAQSICLSHWFGKPRKLFEKRHIHKSAIINDQQFLNSYFLSWFSRIATLYAFFMVMPSWGGFYVFSFYPKYNYMFFLILIVLFLQTWVAIRRVYKRKALKWMLYSAVLISVLAFALSRVNLIDYKRINQICLEKKIAHKYNLELPETEMFDFLYPPRESDIYLVNRQSDTTKSRTPVVVFYGKELSFDELEQNLQIYLQSFFIPQVIPRFPLYIDKSIKMSYVNRLKKILTNVGVSVYVGYAAIPKYREFDKRYYSNHYSAWRLLDPKVYKHGNLEEYEVLSVYYANDSLKINDIICPSNDFYSKLKEQIEMYDNYLLLFTIDNEETFDDYIFVLSELKRAVVTIRNEYALKYYSVEFEKLDFKSDSIIRNKIPIRLMEMNSEK